MVKDGQVRELLRLLDLGKTLAAADRTSKCFSAGAGVMGKLTDKKYQVGRSLFRLHSHRRNFPFRHDRDLPGDCL